MKTFKKAFYFPLLFLLFLFNLSTLANAANIAFANVPIEGGDSITVNGAILQIGNQLLCKNTADFATCQDPGTTGDTQNNHHLQHRARIDTSVAHSNTMAKLVMQAGDEIVLARLYWSARAVNSTDAESAAARDIRIKGPASTTYTLVTSPVAKHGSDSYDYGASADVTDYIKTNGAGDYYVGDILTDSGGYGIYASWQLVVVVKNAARTLKNIAIYDGFDSIYWDTITVDATGFITPRGSDLFNANLFIYAGETDDGYGDNTEIYSDVQGWVSLIDGQNDANDVMNASVSSPDYTNGYRDQDPAMANPNFRNVLGVDIDKLVINDENDLTKQTLSNSQTSTQIRLTSTGDLYSLNMFAFETEVYVPEFCYDYAYKQQGKYFTELNDGSNAPKIEGDVLTNVDVNVTVFIRNLVDSDIEVTDMYVDIVDINTTQATYVRNSTHWAMVPRIIPEPIPDSDLVVDDSFIKDIDIGTISSNDYFYLYYTLNPLEPHLDMPLNVEANYNLEIDGMVIPYKLILGPDIKLCSTTNFSYEPVEGQFNLVHEDYYNSSTTYYNLPTQVTSREGNFKVISMDPNNLNSLQALPNRVKVSVELIDISAFHDTFTACKELESAISPRIWVEFNGTSSTPFNQAALIAASNKANALEAAGGEPSKLPNSWDFYKNANENTAFRISYNEVGETGFVLDYNESTTTSGFYVINNFVEAIQVIGECSHPVFYFDKNNNFKKDVTQVATACGNNGNSIPESHLEACLECIYGYNTALVCSRDNFSIRPEALLIKMDDQNQTGFTSYKRLDDDGLGIISGVTTPTARTLELASGYKYHVEVNATNHRGNEASPGYTKTYGIINDDRAQFVWNDPLPLLTGCNDDSNKTLDIRFLEGYTETNTSVHQVGEYYFNKTDVEWTTVDNNPAFMGHHTGANFLNSSIPDCILGSTDTEAVGTVAGSAMPLNGCTISSNHDSSGTTLKYRDYYIEFHPYDFNLTIVPTVGLNYTAINDNNTSYIYMADMSFNNGQDENMSYHLNGNIIAQDYNGTQLSNFVDNCYAKPLDISISKTDTTLNDTDGNPIVYQYRFHDINATGSVITALDIDGNDTTPLLPVQIQVIDDYFTKDLNGLMNTRLNLNYNREINTTANPTTIAFSKYDVNCTSCCRLYF